jgi:8-oxo-dGTP diphosphatase
MSSDTQGLLPSQKRYHLIPRTLIFVTAGDEVLLLKGAPSKKIWASKYNGLGGHVERGETVHTAALREIREETGVAVKDLRLRGTIIVDADETAGIGLFVFTATALSREVTASHEGTPEWVRGDQVIHLDLVEDLPLLLPRVLAMKSADPPFTARYSWEANGKLVMEFSD